MPQLTARFVKSINGTDPILSVPKPHIVFMGRSNVGKSSLINSLVAQKLARSSSHPGKTINLDFFIINESMYFVDLPGYGFANRGAEKREHFRKLIVWYLLRSGVKPKLVVIILDAKVGLTDYDRETITLLTEAHISFIIIANKIDKLKTGPRLKAMDAIKKDIGNFPIIAHSIQTGEGKREILSSIFSP